ncbi:MAG: tetratricopeptide repeat protein [bacterium]|nr:tetratricopeptide repeat protein [bacterium]MCP5067493.1 tetratricopeptide repeat protein [bacterium]
MTLRPIAHALLVMLLWAGMGMAEGTAVEERLTQANQWLADRERWDDAIEIYRDALRQDPTLTDASIRLARVLAWQLRYDEALAVLDTLIGEAGNPEYLIERAEIYSWAGQLDAAERDFDAVLMQDPNHARAYRGLARVFMWSERKSEADRAFRRALSLEENEEARRDWDQLRSNDRPSLEPSIEFVTDSYDFDALRVGAIATFSPDFETTLSIRTNWLKIDHLAEPEFLRGDTSEKGRELGIDLERGLSELWSGRLSLAGRSWRDAPDRLIGELEFDYSGWSDMTFQIAAGHRDQWEDAHSLPALRNAIQTTYARLGVWRHLGERSELYANIEGGRLTDGNRLVGSYMEVGFAPLEQTDAQLVLSGSFASYHRHEDIYYSPELDGSLGLLARKDLALSPTLGLRLEAGAGMGSSREFGAWSSGLALRAAGILEWKFDSWALRAEGRFDQSQRAATYRTSKVGLELKRSF